MPELPEVETVKETLKRQVMGLSIVGVDVYYHNIIAVPSSDEFCQRIVGQRIENIMRRGKWLVFELEEDVLLSHLRMEGKYFLKEEGFPHEKHEHVAFHLSDGRELRYRDTRKFGRMYLYAKEIAYEEKPLSQLGLEPWDEKLTVEYLKSCYERKSLSIKTVLLDQGIITGIGNIYANEILFLCHISPYQACNTLTKKQLSAIIENTRKVLEKAILLGGSTIRSYESSEGVHGRFQNELLVHDHEGEACPICGTLIVKEMVNGRGTYYCSNCQKKS